MSKETLIHFPIFFYKINVDNLFPLLDAAAAAGAAKNDGDDANKVLDAESADALKTRWDYI